MQFDIRSNAREISRWLDDTQKKQIPFATVLAMTLTARDIQAGEISVMNKVFDRPTPYAINALKVTPATKRTMIASVSFREGVTGRTDAKRFLNPEVHGGARSRKSSERQMAGLMSGRKFFVPDRSLARDAYGNVPGSLFVKILSQLKVSRDATQNATNSSKSKNKRKAESYFVPKGSNMLLRRNGKQVTPVLNFVVAPSYRKRFPFYETAEKIYMDKYNVNFEVAFQRAMATSGFKSASTFKSIGQTYSDWRSSSRKSEIFG